GRGAVAAGRRGRGQGIMPLAVYLFARRPVAPSGLVLALVGVLARPHRGRPRGPARPHRLLAAGRERRGVGRNRAGHGVRHTGTCSGVWGGLTGMVSPHREKPRGGAATVTPDGPRGPGSHAGGAIRVVGGETVLRTCATIAAHFRNSRASIAPPSRFPCRGRGFPAGR